jgi:hypothetical protein
MHVFAFNSFNDLFKRRRFRVADEAKVPVPVDDPVDSDDLVEEDEGEEVTDPLFPILLFLTRTGET